MASTLKFVAASFAAGIVAVGAGAASAFEVTRAVPGGNQTACLDIAGFNTADGTPINASPAASTCGYRCANMPHAVASLPGSAAR